MDFQKLIDYRNHYNRFSTRIGIVLEELREGYALARKTVEVDDTRRRVLHAGGQYVWVCGAYVRT